ncbi:MAG: Protein FecR [Luteibacter sp.]|uniref:FecR family protein n=1 Tax=Luteibacter sp. TaxID=1886636 RepID=UPI001381B073|nr:FecR domain-containing protein [Luteibacter sp.]KAF1005067.1 MAG: Protein FecR [Luteibacter sp.]
MTHDFESLPRTAEAWVARLASPRCSVKDREAFSRWLQEEPGRDAAFVEASRLHDAVLSLRQDAMLRASTRQGRERTGRGRRRRQIFRFVLPTALAASLLIWLGVSGVYTRHAAAPVAQEQHVLGAPDRIFASTLPDGTKVVLDAGAAMSLRFDDDRRIVTMERGRVEFVVAHTGVPFEVRAGSHVIHDIGTTFQVSDIEGAVTVGLLEGAVSIDRASWSGTRALTPNQQIRFAADGSTDGVTPLDVDSARGWTRGELFFRQHRLDDLLTEMNRYSETKIRLGDRSLGAVEVSGSFHAGDQQALVRALEAGWSLRVERRGTDELVLYPDNGTVKTH